MERHLTVFRLSQPAPASALQRHAFDVVRYGITASSDSPPGIYWDPAANELAFFNPYERPQTPQSDGPETPVAPSTPELLPLKDKIEENLQELGLNNVGITRPYIRTPRGSEIVNEGTEIVNEGSYIRTTMADIISYPRDQAYTVKFTVPQDIGNNRILNLRFKMLLDTGSSETWIFGADTLRLSGDNDISTFKEEERAKMNAPRHTCYRNHGFDPSKTSGYWVEYVDKSRALLGLLDHKISFSAQIYNVAEGNWLSNLQMQAHFGIAFAVNDQLMKDPWDGILGLALNRVQVVFATKRPKKVIPSFFEDLQPHIPCSPIDDITIMYFNLWEPRCGVGHYSWLAFNQWPCKEIPEWSGDIRVRSGSLNGSTASWIVRLQEIVFQFRRHKSHHWQDLPNGRISCDIEASLDTGASLTYLPSDVVQKIRSQIFHNAPLNPSEQQHPGDLPYTVKSTFFEKNTFYVIVLKFAGMKQSDHVAVSLPLRPFVCAQQPWQRSGDYEGLIFGMDENHGSIATLGLNFFHAAVVALHSVVTPDISVAKGYVKLAAKYEDDAFDLPLSV